MSDLNISKTKALRAPSIHIKNLTLSYQDHLLFDHFNLDIPKQKCLCLLGPSGVGKTTILRLIANLINDNNTHILEFSLHTSDQKPLKHRIAYMAQQALLMPWLTILDNVLLGYRLRGENIKKHKPKALSLLKEVGLENAAHKRPSQLSGGMKQRAALARTLMENHSVILMDEPFSALDVISRLRLQNLAARLLTDKTVLLITHDPLEALRLADIIYVLSGSPVKLSAPILPKGPIPRDPEDTDLLKLNAQLLHELTLADQQGGVS